MKSPKKEIMLQNTAQGIVAHFLSKGAADEEIKELFETHILPTAFLDMTVAADEIKKLNPDYTVSII